MLSDGRYGIVKKVEVRELETAETTYNFEVEEFHTYYVGKQSVCTHNTAPCDLKPGTDKWNKAVKDIKNSAKNKGKLNYTVKDQATAEALAREAGLPLQKLNDVIYVHDTSTLPNGALNPKYRYDIGFEIHPVDNDIGLEHLKFWSGRTKGHIYWGG